MKMLEFRNRTGSRLCVMDDQFRPGRFAYGVAIGDGPMRFVGDIETYNEAVRRAREQRRKLVRQRKRERGGARAE